LVTPYTFSPQHQPPIESPSKTAVNDLVSQYLTNDIEVIDHNMLGTYMDEQPEKINTPPPPPPPPGGKNIAMIKRAFDEETLQAQPQRSNKNKRKRVETPLPRQVGRPTTNEALIKIDGEEDDTAILQLNCRELTLSTTGCESVKKSKTILTKCKHDIIVTTNKQFLTYELFADARRKALDIIKEQRDMLQKINAAEYVLTTLLKKHSS
jgi:hypothetical protein